MVVAIDTETYYDKDLSVTTMGVHKYSRETDIYLVTMAGDNGLRFAGSPKDAPWDEVAGQTWLMHNAGFDLTMIDALIEKGTIPEVSAKETHDTADLAAFLGYPRSLKEAAHYMLGVEMSKETRNNMKGKQWHNMTPEFQSEVLAYAIKDAEMTLKLWQEYGDQWPETERYTSAMTRRMVMRGVPVNRQAMEQAITDLFKICEAERLKLPWAETRAILAPDAIREECAKVGIWAPKSFAKTKDELALWEEEFADKYEWVKAVKNYRSLNKHLGTVGTMLSRTNDEGWMPYELKYFGATTGRDSGEGGWNAQNLPRDEVAGVNLRKLIEAPKGYKLVVCDLSQIESRVIHYLARDQKFLDILKSGVDVYEAHARATMGYTDPRPLADVDPGMRQLAKARELGLGFQCGPEKFVMMAWSLAKLRIDLDNSTRVVADYRRNNPLIVKFWNYLQNQAARAKGTDYSIELPEGRTLYYRDVAFKEFIDPKTKKKKYSLSAVISRKGKMIRSGIYGGLLAENVTQGYAAAIFMNRCREIEKTGYDIVMRVHDEAVCLVPEEGAENHSRVIESIMSTAPSWCSSLPLGAKAHVCTQYTK